MIIDKNRDFLGTYLNRIVLLDIGVWVSDGSTVVGDDVGDLVLSHSLSLNAAELERGLLGVDLMGLVSALHVVENSEVLSSLFNGNGVHDTEWESGVSSHFVVNLDQSFLVLNNLDGLLSGKSVMESASQENIERNTFSSFVGSS